MGRHALAQATLGNLRITAPPAHGAGRAWIGIAQGNQQKSAHSYGAAKKRRILGQKRGAHIPALAAGGRAPSPRAGRGACGVWRLVVLLNRHFLLLGWRNVRSRERVVRSASVVQCAGLRNESTQSGRRVLLPGVDRHFLLLGWRNVRFRGRFVRSPSAVQCAGLRGGEFAQSARVLLLGVDRRWLCHGRLGSTGGPDMRDAGAVHDFGGRARRIRRRHPEL